MVHPCIDWNADPPARKIPFLILKRGDDRVYTVAPKHFQTLKEVARREFNLDNVDITFSSACANFCDGLPARITEAAWEHVGPYIGCITVDVHSPEPTENRLSREQSASASTSTKTQDEPTSSIKRKLPADADDLPNGKPDTLASETMRDEQSGTSDHGSGHGSSSASENKCSAPSEEEVSVILPQARRFRKRRHVVTEDEEEESGREQNMPARSREPPVESSPKSTTDKEIKKERTSDAHSHLSQPVEPFHQTTKPLKQEKRESGSESGSRPYSHDTHSQPQSQLDVQTQHQIEPNEKQKLMIRVAHRPSKQESKFTTKSTTKVAKVLAGACKSFGLDASRATMYLIISTEDEEGEEENLFPCDKNDSIARAGAERDTESRFLLKIAGEA